MIAGPFTNLNFSSLEEAQNIDKDALIAVLGIETDIMRFGYSFDITISDLTPATGGAHELSMTLKFDCKPEKNPRCSKS